MGPFPLTLTSRRPHRGQPTSSKLLLRQLAAVLRHRHPRSDRYGWRSYARPIRAAASTIIIFSLMSNRQDGYLGLVVDFKEGHVSCGPEWDHELT